MKKIQIVDVSSDEGLIIRCMAKDPTHNEEEALKEDLQAPAPRRSADPGQRPRLVKRLFSIPKR